MGNAHHVVQRIPPIAIRNVRIAETKRIIELAKEGEKALAGQTAVQINFARLISLEPQVSAFQEGIPGIIADRGTGPVHKVYMQSLVTAKKLVDEALEVQREMKKNIMGFSQVSRASHDGDVVNCGYSRLKQLLNQNSNLHLRHPGQTENELMLVKQQLKGEAKLKAEIDKLRDAFATMRVLDAMLDRDDYAQHAHSSKCMMLGAKKNIDHETG